MHCVVTIVLLAIALEMYLHALLILYISDIAFVNIRLTRTKYYIRIMVKLTVDSKAMALHATRNKMLR